MPLRQPRVVLALYMIALLLLPACGDADATAGAERVDSAGVALVTSTGQDRPLSWTFEPELTLGGDDFYHVGRWNVRADSSQVIHVLDRDGKRVLRYASDGTPLASLGRPGSGPGELEWPNILDVTPDGRVNVSDFGRGRVITWAADGSLLNEDVEADPGSMFLTMHGGEVRTLDESGRDGATNRLVYITGGQDTTDLAAVEWTGRAITLESCGMQFSAMPPIFTPTLRWDAAAGRIAVAAGPEYDIRVSDGASPVLRLRRRLDAPAATPAMALEELGEGMRVTTSGGVRVCDPGEVIEQRGMAERAPLIERVAVQPDGRIWVQRFVAGDDPGVIDIFERDGEYLGTLPAGAPMPIGFFPDGRVMTAQTDAVDVQRLVIGRFVEGTDA